MSATVHPPTLTANTTVIDGKTYTATNSGVYNSSFFVYRAFDGDLATSWMIGDWNYNTTTGVKDAGNSLTTDGYLGEWICITLPYSVSPTSYGLSGNMRSFRLYGMAPGSSTWEVLDEEVDVSVPASTTPMTFTLPTSLQTKRYYRFAVAINKVAPNGYGRASCQTFLINGPIKDASQNALLNFDGTTLGADGSAVTTWANSGSQALTSVTSTGTLSASVDSSNRKGVYYSGATSAALLFSGSIPLNQFIQSGGTVGGATIAIVCRFATAAGGGQYTKLLDLASNASGTTDRLWFGKAAGDGSLAADFFNGSSAPGVFYTATNQLTGDVQLLAVTYRNTSTSSYTVELFNNSATPVATFNRTGAAVQNRTLTNGWIGAKAGITQCFAGTLYQVMFFPTALNSTEMGLLVSDMKAKWSIP